jgi:hypothetical protein
MIPKANNRPTHRPDLRRWCRNPDSKGKTKLNTTALRRPRRDSASPHPHGRCLSCPRGVVGVGEGVRWHDGVASCTGVGGWCCENWYERRRLTRTTSGVGAARRWGVRCNQMAIVIEVVRRGTNPRGDLEHPHAYPLELHGTDF